MCGGNESIVRFGFARGLSARDRIGGGTDNQGDVRKIAPVFVIGRDRIVTGENRAALYLKLKPLGFSRSPVLKGAPRPEAGEIVLSVHDDGRGLADPRTALDAPFSRGLGMIGMRARAGAMGGEVVVRSRPGEGVLIEVRVPLRDETHSHSTG